MNPTARLAELTTERMRLLERILSLSEQQRELVRFGNTTELLGLLGIKQKMMSMLETLERALDPFREEDPEKRVWDSESARDACRTTISRCDLLLRKILECDRESEATMQERKDGLQRQIKQLESGRASGEYLRQSQETGAVPHTRLDLKSEAS